MIPTVKSSSSVKRKASAPVEPLERRSSSHEKKRSKHEKSLPINSDLVDTLLTEEFPAIASTHSKISLRIDSLGSKPITVATVTPFTAPAPPMPAATNANDSIIPPVMEKSKHPSYQKKSVTSR